MVECRDVESVDSQIPKTSSDSIDEPVVASGHTARKQAAQIEGDKKFLNLLIMEILYKLVQWKENLNRHDVFSLFIGLNRLYRQINKLESKNEI